GDHRLENLLVAGDTLDITVSPAYGISGIDLAGYEVAVYRFVTGTVTGTGDDETPGYGLRLEQNYPNPFNPSTTISFTLPGKSRAKLSIFDITGRLVKTVRDDVFPEGRQEVVWDGRDERGCEVSSGVYFYRLTAGDRTLTRKMVQLR
ncbi:MAG TPA: T9SS type A sorting domain-containing protein, partial [Candidatus Krumholzibacterium sp.]|nr:T9SS type A sorting domain-containing protein [Candidatus Krumholzibacterium sp.]